MGSVMCGRRGAVGSATAEDVLTGKTFSSDKGVNIAGTMPYRGQYQYTKTMGSGNGYYALNGIPEGCYRAEGQSWAPEIRIAVDDAKKSPMWKDAYNDGFANGKAQPKKATINIGYTKSGDWVAIRINGQQVYSTNSFQSGTHDGIAYFTLTV